jgi:small subunit ribosomal protein S14
LRATAPQPKSFDGGGNYTIGIEHHLSEIDYDKATDIWGMDITVCDCEDRRRARALLAHSTFPSGSEALVLRRGKSGPEAKKSSTKNNRRRRLTRNSRPAPWLKAIARDKSRPTEDRFAATLKLAELPRNSSPSRIHNRCEITGRPKAYYRKLRMSRIALRDLGSKGLIPGLVKSSW